MKLFKKLTGKLAHGILFTSSMVTSVTVLLVVLFLFREGIGLFNQTSVEGHLVIAVHPDNPVGKLSSTELKDIFNQDITNWKEFGGSDSEI
jgi:phosphate transport system permease protein